MQRWVLLCLCWLLAGCELSRFDAAEIDELEYRWGAAEEAGDWRRTDSLHRAPPGRGEAAELRARATLPASTPDSDAAIFFDDPLGLREAKVGEHVVYAGESWVLRPLPPRSAGQTLSLRFASPYESKVTGIYVGPSAELTSSVLRREYDQFVIGVLLAFVGIVLALASLRQPRVAAYAWFGLFSGGLGVVTIGQTTLLSSLLVPSGEFWRVFQSAAIFLYPIGFARFVVEVFGDVRWQLLRRIALVLFVFLLISLVLHMTQLADIRELKRWVYPFLFAAIVPIFRVMIPRAKSDRNALVFMLAFAVLFVIALPDTLRGMGHPILPFHTAHWGILAFTVGLGLVIEGRFREQQRSLKSYSDELASRLDEVQRLNDELRRQIAERSKQLAETLAGATELRPAPAALETGYVVAERYRVIAPLGQGGMGMVYDVERTTDARRLALKLMTGQATPEAAARFAREAEIAARLAHPNLVSVVDVGIAQGALYFAMELVSGGSLDDHRARFGDPRWALPIALQIAEALHALHAAGVVHRDLKAANVLLVDGDADPPLVKVADFGIARSGDAMQLTVTGTLMGTPQYMAPELARGAEHARPTSDVFAFGVLAAELVTGSYPFASPPVYAALYGRPMPALELAGEGGVVELIRACLDPDPERRPSISNVLDQLRGRSIARTE